MRAVRHGGDADELTALDEAETRVLGARCEREILREMAECRRKLAEALAEIPGAEIPGGADTAEALTQYIAGFYARHHDGPAEARLGAILRRYRELRARLALANMRLVAHVARRFRDRGVAYADLVQEGFCGLLEAIDRFDLGHETKLATYATWWIRQAMQRAVAGGAYPVRLSPRHLRQLARSQDETDHRGGRAPGDGATGRPAPPSEELIRRIHAATRPTISLDASLNAESDFRLSQTMSDPGGDRTGDVETDEAVGRLLGALRPRERQVVSLRFGLDGGPRMSLSQVGKILEVSKERIRQIQDRALERLRSIAAQEGMVDVVVGH